MGAEYLMNFDSACKARHLCDDIVMRTAISNHTLVMTFITYKQAFLVADLIYHPIKHHKQTQGVPFTEFTLFQILGPEI